MAGFLREDILVPWLYIADAFEKWPGADEPTQTAFGLASNSDLSGMFEIMALTPGRAERFTGVMSHLSRNEDIGKDYPWSDFGSGTVIDCGGSKGHIAYNIAKQHPELKVIVQDRPEIVTAAQAEQQDGVQVSFMAHDFFQEQPVKGADAYMFRVVFHDWNDKYASRILQALIPAMKAGSKLLLVEAAVPPWGALPDTAQKRLM